MMDTNDQLSALFAAALEQQEAAKAAVADLAQERKALAAAVEAIKNASSSLQTATGNAASKAVTDSLNQAPKSAVTALNTATGALDEATDKVRNAGAWISWKFALVFAFAGAAAVATNYAIGRFTLPDRAEIEALRSEKAQLEASIANLTKRGGKIKFNTCGGRLCIEASSNQGETAPNWKGAAWHNEQNGAALVIPRGY
jgi:hypothetical protein